MRVANVIKIEVSDEQRIKRLVKNYTVEDKEALINSIEKITKKLGGQNAKTAITEVENNNFDKAVSIILKYYDKAYLYGLSKRKDENVHSIKLESENPVINAKKVKEYLDNKFE
jgi:tRNA 2-selenouridine synthase